MPTADDLGFKELALKNNKINSQQADECMKSLRNYEETGMNKPFSTIAMEKGYMTVQDINAIYQLQGKQNQYIIQGYTILETVGQGGLGIVYKARDSMNRIVALKVMFPHLTANTDYLKRFMREAKISTELDHPNIVKGLSFGESAGLYFFAMEFINGRSLKEIIKNVGKFSEKEGTYIILKVAEALKYAEDHNLVHRDIKPENIMVTQDGIPKLCDLGLAKTTDSDMSLTHTGMVVGTPYYISPEQALSQKDLDIRSDIYSLGITFYYLLTAQVPYEGDSVVSIISKHLSHDIPCPREKSPEISTAVCEIITKMMAKQREARYQTAQELIVDLNRLLRNEKPILSTGMESPASENVSSEQKTTKSGGKKSTVTVAKIKKNEPIAPDQAFAQKNGQGQKDITQADTLCMPADQAAAYVQTPGAQDIGDKTPLPKAIVTPEKANTPQGQVQGQMQSQELVKHLEANLHTRKKSKAGRMVLAALVLLAVSAGGFGHLFRGQVSDWYDKLRIYWDHYVPADIVATTPAYRAGDISLLHKQAFEKSLAQIPAGTFTFKLVADMVEIRGGPFQTGSKNGDFDEQINEVVLTGYFLDKQEVSNRAYAVFCKATGHPYPPHFTADSPATGQAEYPVVNVSFYDASLYVRWLGKRLPTEAEWEYAVKGKEGHEYPWGREFQKGHANIATGRLSEATAFPKNKTAHGLLNMPGNVWEWTGSIYAKDGEDLVIKGGSFAYTATAYQARASYRDGFMPYGKRDDLGFRCAASMPEEKK